MKKAALIFTLLLYLLPSVIIISSCSKNVSPEDEVREFAEFFAKKISDGQIDSLKYYYPDILKADSIVTFNPDSITISGIDSNQYLVTLANGITLKINRDKDGQINVTESHGLFSFPEDRIEIAKKTGMWDDSLNDLQLNERMTDDEFFDFIRDSKKVNTSGLISIGDFIESWEDRQAVGIGNAAVGGWQFLTNNTDVIIDGSDYKIIYDVGYWWPDDEKNWTETKPGKTIAPHGTLKIDDVESGAHSYRTVKSIKWELTSEQIQEKFAPFTGHEYNDYLGTTPTNVNILDYWEQ